MSLFSSTFQKNKFKSLKNHLFNKDPNQKGVICLEKRKRTRLAINLCVVTQLSLPIDCPQNITPTKHNLLFEQNFLFLFDWIFGDDSFAMAKQLKCLIRVIKVRFYWRDSSVFELKKRIVLVFLEIS